MVRRLCQSLKEVLPKRDSGFFGGKSTTQLSTTHRAVIRRSMVLDGLLWRVSVGSVEHLVAKLRDYQGVKKYSTCFGSRARQPV